MDLDQEFINHIATDLRHCISDGFDPILLKDEKAQEIYIWAKEFYTEHKMGPTKERLQEEFPWSAIEAPKGPIGDVLSRIRERYGRIEGEAAIRRTAKLVISDPKLAASQMIKEGRDLDRLLSSKTEYYESASIDSSIHEYHKRVAKGKGFSFGFDEIDDFYRGVEAMTFICASPGSLKTWHTVKSLVANILEGKRCYLAGLEMNAIEYDMRIRCMLADIPFWKFLKCKLEDEDLKAIREASKIIEESEGDYLVEKAPAGKRHPEYIFQRALDNDSDIIYIDQLQYMETENGINLGSTNDTKDYWRACNLMRDLSDTMPFWVVHQLSRAVLNNGGEFPVMQQIKGSAAIEETATLAMALHSTKDMRDNNIVQFGAMKSRNFPLAIWEIETEMKRGCSLRLIDRC